MVSHHSPRAIVVLRPVAAGEVGIGDRGAGIGGMDELAAANVNAHMGNAAGICTGKENDVAGLQAVLVHVGALAVLVGGGAVGGEAQLFQNIVHEAGAVEAAGRSAAVNVGGTQILLGFRNNVGTGGGGGRTGGGRTRRGGASRRYGAVQRGGAGGDAGGLAETIEFGTVGRCLIFVGNFRQAQIVAADIADAAIVDDLVPAVVQAENVAFLAAGSDGHFSVGSGGAGAQVDAAAGNLAIAKLGVFPGKYLQIVLVHVADLQIVIDLVPLAGFADDRHAVIAGGIDKGRGTYVGFAAKPQGAGSHKSDAVHGFFCGECGDGHGADTQHQCQHHAEDSFDLHTFASVFGRQPKVRLRGTPISSGYRGKG